MKKSLLKRPGQALRLTAVACGLLGLLLRFWLEVDAIDDRGLLIAGHPAQISLWALGLGMTAALFLVTFRYQNTKKKAPAPKKNTMTAVGCIPAIIALALSMLQTEDLGMILLSAITLAGLVTVALCRYLGKTPPMPAHGILCVWMVVMLLRLYRTWSFDPQLHDYCFQLLAYVALSVASYQYAAMDNGLGSDRKLWFWSLLAGFLCLTTLNAGIQYLAFGIWALTNLPAPKLRKVS